MQTANTTAIVTGGASGLGAATAAALAAAGSRVIALDLAAACEAGPNVEGVQYQPTDVTSEEEVRAAVATASDDPSRPLRIVVNCAGIGPSTRILGRKGVHDLALFRKVVEINLVGSFTVLAIAAEAIAATEPDADGQRGVVINTASIAAFDGQVGQAAYSSSKGGIVGLTLPAARDLAQYGIRVVTIAPGIVETPMLATVSDEFRAAWRPGAVPAAPRPTGGVREARARRRRPRLPQRRDDPHGRRAVDGSALTLTDDLGTPSTDRGRYARRVARALDHRGARVPPRRASSARPTGAPTPQTSTSAPASAARRTRTSRVEALEPDLVVANKEENRELDVRRLRAAGVQVWVTEIETVPEALDSLERLYAGAPAGQDPPGWSPGSSGLGRSTPRLHRRRADLARPVDGRRRPTYTATCSTTGLGDRRRQRHRYPQVDPADVDRDADLVLLPDEPYEFTADDGPEAFARTDPAGVRTTPHLVRAGDGRRADFAGRSTCNVSVAPGGFPQVACAPLAQSVERFHGKEKVFGSIPTGGSGPTGPARRGGTDRTPGGVAQLVRAHDS